MGVSWMVKVVGVVGVVGVRTQGLAPSCPALRPLPSSTSHDPRLISHNLKKHRVSSCVSVTDEGLKNEVHPRHIQEDTRCFFKLWHTDHLDHPINTHPPARTYMGVPKPKPTAPSHPLNQGPKPWDRACGPKLQRAGPKLQTFLGGQSILYRLLLDAYSGSINYPLKHAQISHGSLAEGRDIKGGTALLASAFQTTLQKRPAVMVKKLLLQCLAEVPVGVCLVAELTGRAPRGR
eukprot:643871-Prorocentrum_minimum.AAC.1